jgi:hypothetical protein
LDVETLIHGAAKLEFFVFAITFFIAIGILSLGAAKFIVSAVLDHTFPRWQEFIFATWQHLRAWF